MILLLTYPTPHTSSPATLTSTINFNLPRSTISSIIQPIIDQWENEGFTIDQGGDDEYYELDFADGDPQPSHIYEFFLSEIERELCNVTGQEWLDR